MDRHSVRSGGGEAVKVLLRLDNHEMHVERKLRDLAHRLDHRGAEGEIGNEPPVHPIDVNQVSATGLEHRDLVRKLAEVSAQNRWCDANAHRSGLAGAPAGGGGGGGGGGTMRPGSSLICGGGGKWDTV